VVAIADGGGLARAAPHPIAGAERVARLLANFVTVAPDARGETTWLNGAPAVLVNLDGHRHATLSLLVHEGRVTRIYAVNNPEKLTWLDEPAPLAR
jgi:RNA polymerase sigma-70 factor (ECF subfamily)